MSQDNKLALVAHGFADDYLSPWWRPVRTHLRDWGYDVLEIDFDGIGRTVDSPAEYAHEVKEVIDNEYDAIEAEFDPDEIVVVAHSMGGLTTRYCIEQLGYTREVDTLITFNTPHQGAWLAAPFCALGLDGAKALSPGSDFLSELNDDGVSEYVDYLNVYAANDPVFLDPERAHLPEGDAGNVTNVEIGRTPGDIVSEAAETTTQITSEWLDDYWRDVEDLFDRDPVDLLNPWSWLDPDNQPRVVDPRLVGFRLGRLYNASKIEPDDLLTGHLTIFYNQETWDVVGDYLDVEDTEGATRTREIEA